MSVIDPQHDGSVIGAALTDGLRPAVQHGDRGPAQAQRIALARGLLQKGGVLILDEATSAVDAVTEQRLLENLSTKYKGAKTIIFISHREAVTSCADEVLKIQ